MRDMYLRGTPYSEGRPESIADVRSARGLSYVDQSTFAPIEEGQSYMITLERRLQVLSLNCKIQKFSRSPFFPPPPTPFFYYYITYHFLHLF